MAIKALDLFDAYKRSQFPSDKGFIVSSFFSPNSTYSRYEVISYSNVKSIFPEGTGLTFQADGKKIHILIEPANYPNKAEEPYIRKSMDMIPHRFSELELYTSKNQTKIYYSKEGVMSYTAFTVLKPQGINFAFIFFPLPDVYDNIVMFFEKTFNKEAGVPLPDAKKVSKMIGEKLKTALKVDFS